MHQHTARNEKEPAISDPRTNERIRVPEVRLVGPAGEQVGVVRVEDALRLAREAELDLVEVAPEARPPVVKIMDFGKFKYEQAQKVKEARRNQANTVLKEVRFRLKIDEHDYETKRKRAEGFLKAGDKVKAMILFRGREQSRPDQGVRLLQRFAEDVADFGSVESSPMIDGRNMVMIVGPMRSKSDAKAELNAVRSAQRAADQEKRRVEAERQAARQAALDAERPERPVLPASSAVAAEAEFRSRPSTGPSSSSRPASGSSTSTGSSRPSTGASRPASAASSRPASSTRPSSDSSSDSRPRQQPRTVQPTPAGAPRPAAAAPRPAGAPSATPSAAPAAAPAAPKPAAKPGVPKPAGKPATPSAASKPAAPKAKPAGAPAGEPASE